MKASARWLWAFGSGRLGLRGHSLAGREPGALHQLDIYTAAVPVP